MRLNLTENNRPEWMIASVRNADTSTTQNANSQINVGTPLVLNLSNVPQPAAGQSRGAGAEDGLQVILPSSGNNILAQHAVYGVALGNILQNQLGEAMLFGICQATVVVETRAASTNNWSATTLGTTNTTPASAAAQQLSIDTVNNAFATLTTLASAGFVPPAMLLDSYTMASSASTTADTRTVITKAMRVFVRMM